MASERQGKVGVKALVAGGDASAASTLEADRFSCQTCRVCMPVFWRQMETILRGQQIPRGKMPEGYLHLTCEQRCQIYALCKAAIEPTSRGRLASIRRRSARACSNNRRARLSLQASAREGLAETQGRLGQATQNEPDWWSWLRRN